MDLLAKTATATGSVLVVALLAAALAGCGGDTRRGESEGVTTASSVATTTSPAVTKPASNQPVPVAKVTSPARRAYVTRVDAICRQIEPERGRDQERVGKAADTAEAVNAYDESITAGWRELRDVKAVPAPPGDAALLQANVIEPIENQLALRAKISRALAATDVPLVRSLRTELDNSTRALTGFARGYGFRVCGEV